MTSGAWGAQIIMLQVDSDSFQGARRHLNPVSGRCPFFFLFLSKREQTSRGGPYPPDQYLAPAPCKFPEIIKQGGTKYSDIH